MRVVIRHFQIKLLGLSSLAAGLSFSQNRWQCYSIKASCDKIVSIQKQAFRLKIFKVVIFED